MSHPISIASWAAVAAIIAISETGILSFGKSRLTDIVTLQVAELDSDTRRCQK